MGSNRKAVSPALLFVFHFCANWWRLLHCGTPPVLLRIYVMRITYSAEHITRALEHHHHAMWCERAVGGRVAYILLRDSRRARRMCVCVRAGDWQGVGRTLEGVVGPNKLIIITICIISHRCVRWWRQTAVHVPNFEHAASVSFWTATRLVMSRARNAVAPWLRGAREIAAQYYGPTFAVN